MDCSFVVSVFFIVLLLNTGLQTNGQILTLCKDPLLSTRCTLQCSRRAANETVKLYKVNTVKIECGEDNICSKSDAIHAVTSDAKLVKFRILKLGYADRGYWRCTSGDRAGEAKELQVYSFKEENVAYDIRSISSRRYNLTITIECVMPIPRIVLRFCEEQICRGKGNAYFNGPCAYSGIQTHRKFHCILDLHHRNTRCRRGEEPVQINIMLDDRTVYSKETNEVFSYGHAPHWPVWIDTHDNLSRKSTIRPEKRDQSQGNDNVLYILSALVAVFGCATLALGILSSCFIYRCLKEKGRVPEGEKKEPLLQCDSMILTPNNKEKRIDAEGKSDGGDVDDFDIDADTPSVKH